MYCAVCTAFGGDTIFYLITKSTRKYNIFPSSVEFYYKILYLCKILGENSNNITINI